MHIRRRTAALAVTTVTIATLGAVPAVAEHVEARAIDPACEGAPEDGMTDAGADGSEQETAIDCLAWYEVTQGVTATTYEPAGDVVRGEMAAFLARVMRASEQPFAEAGATEDYFADDEASVFEADINFVAKHDVADGTSETTFSPSARVTRGQMAKFLVAMLTAVGADVPEPSQDYFGDDDQSPFQGHINQVAELGVATGVSDTEYAPAADVTRGQMARFLARSMAVLVEEQLLQTPDAEEPVTTDAPELVAVSDPTFHSNSSCTSTDDEDDAEYVQLTAEFDEAITGRSVPDAADGFSLVGFDASQVPATAARLSTADDSQAEVCFPIDAWTTATTLAVAADTVGDVGDLGNPEGAAGVKAVTLSGTTRPELTSVATVTDITYRFTFDEDIATATAAQFRLVAADGDVLAGSTATVSGDDVTVTFADEHDAAITRVAALGGAVTSERDGQANAISVLRLSGGQTTGPDLVTVAYDPDATRERNIDDDDALETVQVDEVRYVFDAAVLEQDDNVDDFVLVTATGETLTPTVNQELEVEDPADAEDPVRRSDADARTIVVEFADGALQTTTIAAVRDSAVRAAGGSQPANRVDALPRTPQLTYAAGTTLAPSPVEAALSSTNMLLATSYTVTLTFDEPVAAPTEGSTISVYDEAGNAYTFSATPTRDADDPTIVTVSSGPLPAGNATAILDAAVLVGLAPEAVEDAEGHASHAQVIEL